MTPYLEIGGDYREVVPGVFLAELPLPFSLGLINVWFVRLEDGWMLVDTGMDTAPCFAALDRAREGLGLEWTHVRILLLTHFHPDHAGLAHRILELSGAELWMHAADEELLRWVAGADHGYPEWQRDTLTQAGVPEATIDAIVSAMDFVQPSFRPLAAHVRPSGGESIRGAGGPVEVLATPGHSPGHVCLHLPAQRALISGDHVLEHISPNISWQAGRDALGEYLKSLDIIAALDLDLILPSHGSPFHGHREWVARTHSHHQERCAQIRSALAVQNYTAAELVSVLWTRPLSPFHYRFAVFEILSHLEYMKRRSLI